MSRADGGDRNAAAVPRLKADPDRFLATVQIGASPLVGTMASTIGGVAAIERFEPLLASAPLPWLRDLAEPLAVGTVVFSIAYLSLVVGELVPKSLALRWKGTSVQAVMTPLADPIVIDAKAPLLEAMARMASGAGRLLVMQDGKMLGFLTLTSVIRHLRVRGQPALLRGSRRGRSRARGNRVGSTLRTAPPAPCPPRRCRE